MIYQTINYSDDGRVNMVTYIPEITTGPLLPAMIALPGGAWTHLERSEGEMVALTFVKEGYAGFVLNYSVGDYSKFPNPLEEICWAIYTIRQNANKWHIDPDKIAIAGFSAGASVASMSATQWFTTEMANKLDTVDEMFKPNAAILGYGCNDLATIFESDDEDLVIPEPGKISAERTPQLDVVNYVTEKTAPIFFYHCRYDEYVPVKNTWMLAAKLEEKGLDFEMHIFQSGHHGMSVNNKLTEYREAIDPSVTQWVPLCLAWLDYVFGKA